MLGKGVLVTDSALADIENLNDFKATPFSKTGQFQISSFTENFLHRTTRKL
jgi:hypothetical protein